MDVYWLEQEQGNLRVGRDWLSGREAALLAGLRFEKRRMDWLLGRWTAKHAVAAFLKLPIGSPAFANIEIVAADSGAPEVLLNGRPAPIAISISHRGGKALCACAEDGVDLGCDLEIIEPRGESFVADYFTPGEQSLVAKAPAEDRAFFATLFWSAKESALKALHVGLRADTRCVEILQTDALPPQNETMSGRLACSDDSWRALHVRHGSRNYFGWWRAQHGLIRSIVSSVPVNPPIPLTLREAACCS